MAFAAPTQQVAYPVIPPMPVPAQTIVIPNAVQMPQHTMMQMPVPQPASSSAPHVANNPPVIPPIPQNGAGTPFPTAAGPPVIPATPTPFPQPQYRRERSPSSSDSSSEDIPSGPAIQPGQYGLRNIVFDRPESIVFHHHPLPPPPKDVFELSPYIGLLESLHRPPEETLVRNRSGTYPPAAGYVISPVGSHASREKKQRKGLFRGLSERLKGKKRDRDEPTMVLPVMFTAPPGAVQPDTSHIYGPPHMDPAFATPAGQPGMTPGPMFVPPSPSRTHTPVPQPPPKGPPSPAPSHRSRVYSPRQQYQPLKIDLASELAGLTHLSPHLVHFLGKLYPTAFHALEAQRFTETRPDVAEQIRTCESPDQVRAVVSHHSAMGRHDWEQVVLQMVRFSSTWDWRVTNAGRRWIRFCTRSSYSILIFVDYSSAQVTSRCNSPRNKTTSGAMARSVKGPTSLAKPFNASETD